MASASQSEQRLRTHLQQSLQPRGVEEVIQEIQAVHISAVEKTQLLQEEPQDSRETWGGGQSQQVGRGGKEGSVTTEAAHNAGLATLRVGTTLD